MTTATLLHTRKSFVEDSVIASAPPLPTGRPPTKLEVWEHYSHIYNGRKSATELKTFCRGAWAWLYLEYVNFKGWQKHPDWVEGDVVIDAAVPRAAFQSGAYEKEIEQLWQVAHQQRRAA